MLTYQWLAYYPPANGVEVWLVVLGTMAVGRHILQGKPYQYSYSALFGGLMLFFTYTRAGEVLQRPGVHLGSLLQTTAFHLVCLGIGVAAGLWFQVVFSKRGWMWDEPEGDKTEWMDLVYSLFFLPLIVYLCLVTAVIVVFYGGKADWILGGSIYVGDFILLLAIDGKLGMLNQVPWARSHKIRSRNDPK